MSGYIHGAGAALVVCVLALLSACGGGGGGSSGSGSGSSGGSSSSGGSTLTCKQQFNPLDAQANQDCTPTYGAYCPLSSSTNVTNDQAVNACDGTSVATGTATAGTLSSDYVVVKPASGGKSGLYLALHWFDANAPTMVNRLRLSELAKARDVTVVAPTAPGPIQTWGASDGATPTSSVAERIALLDAVVAQVRGGSAAQAHSTAAQPDVAVSGGTQPLVVAGLSGGAIMAFDYACAHAGVVAGAIIVASKISDSDLAGCKPGTSVATVQVHGTGDLVAPYYPVPGMFSGAVAEYQALYTNNGCDAAQIQNATLPSPEAPTIPNIQVQWVSACTGGQGSALVTIPNGGHNWPGIDRSFNFLPLNLYGPVATGFDTTLQGYDLLRYLGG